MANLQEVLYMLVASGAIVAGFHLTLGERRAAGYFALLTAGFAVAAAALYWFLTPSR